VRRFATRTLYSAIAAVLLTTLSGQATALASQQGKQRASHAGKPAAKAITLPRLPAGAEPLLEHLVAVARTIRTDNQRVDALSDDYDSLAVRVAGDEARASALDSRVRRAESQVGKARIRLRQAAIEAYVTDETNAVASSMLSDNLSAEGEVSVYASAASSHVSNDLHAYDAALFAVRSLDRAAHESATQARLMLAALGRLKSRATALQVEAFESLLSIRAELEGLVGPKEFTRLLSPQPVGSPYKGPNLAGIDATTAASAHQGLVAVDAAKRLLGVPYVYGGASKTGVDCSGLVMLAWAAAGVHFEHSATTQWEDSVPVPLSQLQPGDLLFYHFAHDGNTPITHVVMYVGSGPYGANTIIQAAHTGTLVSYGPMFLTGFVSAGRP
jgi:cell wall-associated NlpC family hydrolase